MKPLIISLLLTVGCAFTVAAQETSAQKALDEVARRNEHPLRINTVRNDVSISAVLIPPTDARRIFGREIANKYAVVEVNIGNKSADSALLIQGIFLDYTRWALSGSKTDSERERALGRFAQYQTSTSRNQVASNEYRVVRGHLLDAQNSTWRNRVVNWLTFAVSLASGFDFSLKETGIKTGFGKAGTIGIPSLKTAWPDTTIEQLKAIDDFGFRTGKSVAKNGSEIIVCFFPIDLFLTPTFKQLYIKSPALFFNPLEMLQDPGSQRLVVGLLGKEMADQLPDLHRLLKCYRTVTSDDSNDDIHSAAYRHCLGQFGLREVTNENGVDSLQIFDPKLFEFFTTLDYLNQMSLNNVVVTLDGVLTIDTSAFAAKIDTLTFDKIDGCGDDTKACFWTDLSLNNGVRTGTLAGSYMTGGAVTIAETKDLKLSDTKPLSEGSNDQGLHFSFKLNQAVAPGKKLTFTVVKTGSAQNATGNQEMKSTPKEYVVNYTMAAPTIDKDVVVTGGVPVTITISGKGLSDPAASKPQIVNLKSPSNTDYSEVATSSSSATAITLALPADTQPVGCWTVTVKAGNNEVSKKFVVTPTVTSAQISGSGDTKKLTITGTFLDAKDCQSTGKGLEFQFQNGNQLISLTPDSVTKNKITIPLKGEAADAVVTWPLHIKFNGVEIPMQ